MRVGVGLGEGESSGGCGEEVACGKWACWMRAGEPGVGVEKRIDQEWVGVECEEGVCIGIVG